MKRLTVAIVILSVGSFIWWRTGGATSRLAQAAAAEQRIVLDCSCTRILDDFGNDRAREALLRHLCASAGWHVTACSEIAGPEKRVKRVLEAEKCVNRSQSAGERSWQNAVNTPKVTVRFDSSPPSNWRNGSYALTRAGTKAVDVLLSPTQDDRQPYRSTLMIEGGSLVLEIDEYGAGRDRALTKKAMQQVAEELSAVKDNVESIERDGYLRGWLPSGSVRETAVERPLQIREGLTRGMYLVSGYVNPQEKGYITIRTFHARSGKELDADVNSWRTVQYVGWSLRRKEKFSFECELAAPSYLTEEESKIDPNDPRRFQAMAAEQEIRVEVWFHGKVERKLLDATKMLVPSMR